MTSKIIRFPLIFGVVFCLSFMVLCMTYFEFAHAKEKNGPSMTKSDPSPSQNPKIIDLGDGITLEERTSMDEKNKVRLRISTLRHNGKRMMVTLWNPEAKSSFSRSFWKDDKMVLSEEDTNGDHVPDTLTLYNEKTVPLPWKVFQMKSGGVLIPMSDEKVEQLRKKGQVIMGVMSPIIEEAKKTSDLKNQSDENYEGATGGPGEK